MQSYFAAELAMLSSQLNDLENYNLDNLQFSEQALQLLNKLDLKFKAQLRSTPFASEQEEINYFKFERPVLSSQIIYYNRVYKIELSCPRGSAKRIKKYHKQELKKTEAFLMSRTELISYMRSGSTLMDEIYFVRRNLNYFPASDENYLAFDPEQSTSYDLKVAEILANERLEEYLNLKIEGKKHQDENTQVVPKLGLVWTDNKIALVELIYALHSAGSINHGNKDIKELARCFQEIFNIDLGDYYRAYLDIKMRKTGHAKYIENLSEHLQRRIENQDEV